MSSSTGVFDILAAAVPAPTVRPSTEEDMEIAQQRPMYHEDPVVEMTYNLGGAVAIDDNDHVFRAPDDKIVAALAKAAKLGVISCVPVVEDWLKIRVGSAGVIHTVAKEVIQAESFSGGVLNEKDNMSPGVIAPPNAAETACDILESLLREHNEYEKVREENFTFRKYRSVQIEWKVHMGQSVRIAQNREQVVLEHIREDKCQKQESLLRQQQLIQQEKLLQERLDHEKHERRAVQLEAIEKARADHEEMGRCIKERGQIIHSDLRRLPERNWEKKHPSAERKAFLEAFLQRLKHNQQQQQKQQVRVQVEEDSMEFVNDPSPSTAETSRSFFFRSDSGVDVESLVGEGASGGERGGFIEPKPETKLQGRMLEKKEPLPTEWIWAN